MAAKTKGAPFYRLRITLNDTAPPIWREIVVRSGMTLDVLNEVIQIAMGWTNSHMHMLRVGEIQFGDPEGEFDFPIRDEARATIDEVARLATGGASAVYEYDFGDGWEHDLRIESWQDEPDLSKHKAVFAWCTGGARACPPEDCGGIPGYEDLVEAMADPDYPRHDELIEWLGGVFDPDRFDLAEINQALAKVRA